jgi:rhodanese-related sulfurtransferase
MAALLTRALVLVLIGAGVGLASNAVRSDGVALRGYEAPVTCGASGAPGHAPPVEVLPPARAVTLCSDAGVLIADARPPAAFAAGHIVDAVHLPCAASGAQASVVVDQLAGVNTLIVYGDTTQEARAVAEDLRRRVVRPDLRVVVLDGGFPAWSQAGLACASGPCRTCTAAEQHGGTSR